MQMTLDSTQRPVIENVNLSSKSVWAGRIIGGLPVLFLLVDGAMKLFKPEVVVKATTDLGYPESAIIPIGTVLLASTILYIIPRTAILGAILLTGYLGGAVATHVRVEAGAFPIVFPAIVGGLLWLSLYLRDSTLRKFVPFLN